MVKQAKLVEFWGVYLSVEQTIVVTGFQAPVAATMMAHKSRTVLDAYPTAVEQMFAELAAYHSETRVAINRPPADMDPIRLPSGSVFDARHLTFMAGVWLAYCFEAGMVARTVGERFVFDRQRWIGPQEPMERALALWRFAHRVKEPGPRQVGHDGITVELEVR